MPAACRARSEPVRHTAVKQKEKELKCAHGELQMFVRYREGREKV